MRPLVTPEQMKAADAATIARGTPPEVLMERAGRAVAAEVIALLAARYGRRAVVVCGRGNNGGDGFVAARRLARSGVHATCLLVEPPPDTGPAAAHYRHLRDDGVRAVAFDRRRLDRADVVIDAIFGTGFRGKAEGTAAAAIEAVNASGAPCVAIDVPSGADGATGAVPGPAVRADVTVALAAQKMGSAVGDAAALTGRVVVADIGIDMSAGTAGMAEPVDVAACLPARAADAHKRSAGAVALIAGSDALPGAAQLAARGAERAGSGYVLLGTTAGAKAASDALLPEVLISEISDGRVLGPDAPERFADALDGAACIAVGPGLGADEPQRRLVEHLLEEMKAPLVLDADALNVIAGSTGPLARRTGDTVITPHPGELARLLETGAADVQQDRVGAARRAARLFGCTVLLKGYRTVVAGRHGRVVVVPSGGPELATAGTGDVLTGVVAAMVAAGASPFDAAWAGAYLHGEAGATAARRSGDIGVVAWDVAEALPAARRALTGRGPAPLT